MTSLLLPQVYLVRYLILRPLLARDAPRPPLFDYPFVLPSHCAPTTQLHGPVMEGAQEHPSMVVGTQIGVEIVSSRPMPLTNSSGGLLELGSGLGMLNRATRRNLARGVAAMTRSPRGCGTGVSVSAWENPFRNLAPIHAACRCWGPPCLGSPPRCSGSAQVLVFAVFDVSARGVPGGRWTGD